MTLYDNLQELCKIHGLTPSGLCVELGLSKTIVSRLKNDPSAQISYATAEKMAKRLGVSTETIQHGLNKKDPDTMTDAEAREELTRYLIMLRDRPDLLELLDAAQGLDPEDVKDVTNIAAKLGGRK